MIRMRSPESMGAAIIAVVARVARASTASDVSDASNAVCRAGSTRLTEVILFPSAKLYPLVPFQSRTMPPTLFRPRVPSSAPALPARPRCARPTRERPPVWAEAVEPRRLFAAVPTNFEQYELELLNRARANPNAEVTRLSGEVWGDDPSSGTAYPAPQTPNLNE